MRLTAIPRLVSAAVVATGLAGAAVSAQGRPHPTGRPVSVELFFVAVSPAQPQGDTFGCGDVLVTRQRMEPFINSTLETALHAQLTASAPAGLANTVAALGIKLRSVRIDGRDATVTLEPFSLGGECDNPRVATQIARVIDQFATFHEVDVMVGDRTLAQYLSLK